MFNWFNLPSAMLYEMGLHNPDKRSQKSAAVLVFIIPIKQTKNQLDINLWSTSLVSQPARSTTETFHPVRAYSLTVNTK